MALEPPLDRAEFERLLDRLANEVVDAAIFQDLHADLNASIKEFWREFSQSQTFWSLSTQAYVEVVLHRLSRIYVGHKAALSIGRWLEAIRDNTLLFPAPPNPIELDQDIESVKNGPVVKKLIGLRGNFDAHINWQNTAANLRLGDRFALTFDEIDLLVSRAVTIMNRYSILFKQTAWSTSVVGRRDFQTILNALREHLERSDAEIAEEIERATRQTSPEPDANT